MSVRLRKWKDGSGRTKEAWWVDVKFTHSDGRVERVRKKSPVNTRRGAEQYERQLREALLSGSFGKEVKTVPTFEQFEEQFLIYSRTNNKPSAVYAKESMLKTHLRPAFGKKRLDEILVPDIERFKAEKIRDGYSPKSINNFLCGLRKLLNLAVEYGELPFAPKVKQLRVQVTDIDFLHFEEVPRFLAATPTEWRPLMVVALKTGLRMGELLALKWEDVDVVAGRLVVRRSLWREIEGPPKSGRTREVPLSDEAIATLKAQRAATMLKGPYVFADADGKRLKHKSLYEVVPRICKKAGLAKRLTFHDLRHTFASHLVMRGVALKAVQELLGHATIDMTMRYAHLSPDVKRDAVKLLDHPVAEDAAQGHTGGT